MQTDRPPGPRGLQKFETILDYRRDPFAFHEKAFQKYGPIVMNESLGFKFFLLSSPEDIDHVLVRNARNYTKDFFLQSWKEVFGEGLLTAEGEIWKKERQMVQPSFHRDRMQDYGKLMIERAAETTKPWRTGEIRIDTLKEMTRLTLDIVVRTLFGTELAPGAQDSISASIERCVRYFEFTGAPVGHYLAKLPLKVTREYRAGVRELEATIRGIVEERMKSGNFGNDLLSTLIAARAEDGSAFSQKQIRDELITLFLAGHDTTALALTYTLYLLGRNPEIQKKVRAQILDVLDGGELDVGMIERFSDLKQVIQESMRLYPPAWVIARTAIAEDRLSGFSVPAGADIIIPIWAIHRRSDVFHEPELFHPERWTDAFARGLPRAAYMPFGYGPRMCIGSSFAMMELHLVLATVLRDFEIETLSPKEVHCRPSITLKPKEQVEIRLKPLQAPR